MGLDTELKQEFSVSKVSKSHGLYYLVEQNNLLTFYEQEKKNYLIFLLFAKKIKQTSKLCADS